jgi:hypothetical protein
MSYVIYALEAIFNELAHEPVKASNLFKILCSLTVEGMLEGCDGEIL